MQRVLIARVKTFETDMPLGQLSLTFFEPLLLNFAFAQQKKKLYFIKFLVNL